MEKMKVLATLEEDVLTSVINTLFQKNVRLQAKVDREGEAVLNNIRASSISEAIQLFDYYDEVWFKDCLYSDELKKQIAARLIEQTKTYPVDLSLWESIVNPVQQKEKDIR